jgi:hypothetical protein
MGTDEGGVDYSYVVVLNGWEVISNQNGIELGRRY